MNRLHIHMGVESLEPAIKFYSALFNAEPVKTKHDYAKWMLDEPGVNFAISTCASEKGVNHLGLQIDSDDELAEVRTRLENTGLDLFHEGETECCYARSDKTWVQDPAGVAWEAYRTMADVEYPNENKNENKSASEACCTPTDQAVACCN